MGECCGTVLRAQMMLPKADIPGSPVLLRGLHLSPMYCACRRCSANIYLGWVGGPPLLGPRRAGGVLQGSRERLRDFLGRVVQPRRRGGRRWSLLAGLKLMEKLPASWKKSRRIL